MMNFMPAGLRDKLGYAPNTYSNFVYIELAENI